MGRKLLCTSGRKISPSVPQKNVSGLQTLLHNKFGIWASNGSGVEEIWNNYKEVVPESIKHFVSRKIL